MARKPIIPFTVGDQVQLQVRLLQDRLTTTFIGIEHEKYIILKIPPITATDIKAVFAPGKTVIARYLHQGTILGFTTTIIGIILQPDKLMFIHYPKSIENHKLRKHARIICHLPAEILIKEKLFAGHILDISIKGCRFSYLAIMDVKLDNVELLDDIPVFLTLPGIEGKLQVSGKIRNVLKEEDTWALGIEFTKIPEAVEKKLNQYLNEAMIYNS